MRVPLIAGNWKMNTSVKEARALVREMLPLIDPIDNVEKLVCPPFVSLVTIAGILRGSSIKLGAQNMYFEEKGAYTGEVSPPMLATLCQYVIIGHSERRQYFGETSEIVNRKVQAALKFNLRPIMCIGEKLEEYDARRTEEVVLGQLRSSLSGIDSPGSLVIAYEPVWAIGTGRAATGEQANRIIGLIRHNIAEMYGENFAQKLRILYGGSVTADNTAEFMGQPEIDGALVGGASLKADQFPSIVKQTSDIKGHLPG
jgi:triosephosphate isomerase